MKAHTASLINAIVLIGLSLWAYFTSDTPSPTALIPTGVGVALIICNPGLKKENKVIAHIAVLLTLLILLALIMPLVSNINKGNTVAVIRIAIMMASTIFAKIYFIKSFKAARKAREAQEQQ